MDTVLVFRTGEYETWLEKLGGIADCARERDWSLQVVDARHGRIDLARLVRFWHPCGAIVDASGDTSGLRFEAFGNLPTVLMTPQRTLDGFASVTSDSKALARIAAVELLARDNQAYLFVDWPCTVAWAQSKRTAFVDILALHGHDLTVFRPTAREMRDRPALITRLSRHLAALPRPIGVFAVTDALGAATLDAAQRAHLSVPEDLMVVGVDDDTAICENCKPPLSSVRPSFRELGFTAGNLLQRLLTQTDAPPQQPLEVPPFGLVRRASSAVLRRADPIANRATELIRTRVAEGLVPADVLALFPGSPRLAELRFKAATGLSVRAALLQAKLDRAKGYLKGGRLSIAAIANFCGWESDLAFRKAFKAHVGLTPTAYRASRTT